MSGPFANYDDDGSGQEKGCVIAVIFILAVPAIVAIAARFIG